MAKLIICGFFASFAVTIIFAVSMALGDGAGGWNVIILPIAFAVALGHSLLLGMPAFKALVALKYDSLISALIVGVVIGFGPAAAYIFVRNPEYLGSNLLDTIKGLAEMSGLGAVGGGVFYWSWRLLQRGESR